MKEIDHYECLEDALTFCIRASNKQIKEVAVALWPSDRCAYQRLIDALNTSKRQKLSMEEIIYIMKFCDRYDPLLYMADECLHSRPEKICVEQQQKIAAEMYQKMMNEATKAFQNITRMSNRQEEINNIKSGIVPFKSIIEEKTG